jgi:hypothetical protein
MFRCLKNNSLDGSHFKQLPPASLFLCIRENCSSFEEKRKIINKQYCYQERYIFICTSPRVPYVDSTSNELINIPILNSSCQNLIVS